MTVQTVRPTIENVVGWDLRAEVPPGQAAGLAGLDRRGPVMYAGEDCGVFEAAVEKGAVRVLVKLGCAVSAAPKTRLLSVSRVPVISATPESATPQLRCKAVWRSCSRPPAAIIRSSYQRPFNIGAAT